MMTIYTGNVITDAKGGATVQLAERFEALNTDFRYQLTVIGEFAQAHGGSENEQASIYGSNQRTQCRSLLAGHRCASDAYAKAHPLIVEQDKEANLRGFYICPKLAGHHRRSRLSGASS